MARVHGERRFSRRRILRLIPPTGRISRWLLRLALVEALVAPLTACDPFHTEFPEREPAVEYQAQNIVEAPEPGPELNVMTWNIKFSGGRIDFFFDCHGDRVLMKRGEVISNLEGLAAKIRQVNPDILFMQEVDIASKRVAFVDTLQWLLDHTDLNYGVYASQWKSDYVPSDGIGSINSGNVILSKYPLSDGVRIALPLIQDQDALTRYFYLRRNILKARIDFKNRDPLWVITMHASAYSTDGTKKKQIDRFKKELDALDDDGHAFVAGGDFNALPPDTVKVKDFPDSACTGQFEADDYSKETTWLDALYQRYDEAIPLEKYAADNTPYFSHTTDKNGFWNRRLDYLWTNQSFRAGLVHQDEEHGGMVTMPLSDHAPVSAKLRLP